MPDVLEQQLTVGFAVNSISVVTGSTGNLTSWNPGANNTVLAIFAVEPYLFIGGSFTIVGGQVRTRLASFNLYDGSLTSWNPSANGDVRCFSSKGSILYVGGTFTLIAGITRNRIAGVSISTGAGSKNITSSLCLPVAVSTPLYIAWK